MPLCAAIAAADVAEASFVLLFKIYSNPTSAGACADCSTCYSGDGQLMRDNTQKTALCKIEGDIHRRIYAPRNSLESKNRREHQRFMLSMYGPATPGLNNHRGGGILRHPHAATSRRAAGDNSPKKWGRSFDEGVHTARAAYKRGEQLASCVVSLVPVVPCDESRAFRPGTAINAHVC